MKKAALFLLITMVFFSQNPCVAEVLNGSDSFDGTEATMSPRFFRSGTPGDSCSTFSSGNFQYKAYPFKSDAGGSLTVDFNPATLGTGIFVTFHQGSFNPASICENYLWSFGSSQAYTGQTFSVPPDASIVMVVSGVANAPGVVGGPYSWTISGISTSKIPTMNEWGMIIFSVLLGISAVMRIRKRNQTA
jgi:hypothetical protein